MDDLALPDLPEIQDAGFGLTEALALWSRFHNTPRLTPDLARAILAERRDSEKSRAAGGPSSPNVIQFSQRPAR
jgi:hypothetical protein